MKRNIYMQSRCPEYDTAINLLQVQILEVLEQNYNDNIRTKLKLQYTVVTDLYDLHELFISKDTDYSESGKPLGNIRSSEDFGIPAWKGVLIRLNDKKQRIGSFMYHDKYLVESEKVTDTLLDFANYSLFCSVLLQEKSGFDNDATLELNDSLMEAAKAAILFQIHIKLNDDTIQYDPKIYWTIISEKMSIIAELSKII